jgi:hypothetical protein
LPPGLAMNPSSVMTGTPTIAGTTIFTVKVVDSSAGTITKELTLTVIPASAPVTITSLSPLPAGTVGTVYSTTLVALGGTPGLSWTVSSGALPAGLNLNPTTGQSVALERQPGPRPLLFGCRTADRLNSSTRNFRSYDQRPIGGGGSGGSAGELTLTSAPSSAHGKFAPGALPNANVVGGQVVWFEQSNVHTEIVAFNFNINAGQDLHLEQC